MRWLLTSSALLVPAAALVRPDGVVCCLHSSKFNLSTNKKIVDCRAALLPLAGTLGTHTAATLMPTKS